MKKKIIIITSIIILLFISYTVFMAYKAKELVSKYKTVDTELEQKISALSENETTNNFSPETSKKVELLRQNTALIKFEIETIKDALLEMGSEYKGTDSYLFKENHIYELKESINKYKIFLTSEFDNQNLKQHIEKINMEDIAENGKKTTWEETNFRGMPLAAIFKTLDDLIYSIENVETEIIKEIK